MDSVGIVGVGLLGTALAERLLLHEYPVLGYDQRSEQLDGLAASGGKAASSCAEVVECCSTVFLSLPTSRIAADVLDQVRSAMRPGQVVVDTTTGDPDEMIANGSSVARCGAHYVEASVAGSSTQLRAGEVCLFLGGDEPTVTRIQPLLSPLSDRIFHLGEVGAASRFKLVHNLVLGLHRAILAEGLVFAEALGFDVATTLEILQQTPAASTVMESKGPKMAAEDWTPQARLSQHLKDVRLILDTARNNGVSTPFSRLHGDVLEEAERMGLGDADNSAILLALRQLGADARG